MTLPTLYKLSDAVKALGPGAPSEWKLRKEIADGNLVAKRIGRCLRVSDVELTRWVNDTGSQDVPGPSSGGNPAQGPGPFPHPAAQPQGSAALPEAAGHPDTSGTGSRPDGVSATDGTVPPRSVGGAPSTLVAGAAS